MSKWLQQTTNKHSVSPNSSQPTAPTPDLTDLTGKQVRVCWDKSNRAFKNCVIL